MERLSIDIPNIVKIPYLQFYFSQVMKNWVINVSTDFLVFMANKELLGGFVEQLMNTLWLRRITPTKTIVFIRVAEFTK